MKTTVKYFSILLFTCGILAVPYLGNAGTSNIKKTLSDKTLSVQTTRLPDLPRQQHIIQQKESQPFSKGGDFSAAAMQASAVIPPAAVRYFSAGSAVVHFTIRLYTRYLPRDPTV